MSSGQWEVVGKSKKAQNGKAKPAKDDEKKPAKNGSKLEDVLPHSQIKSFYNGMAVDSELRPTKDNKKKDGDKKAKKQQGDKKPEPKPKPPKTIEGALEIIDATELSTIITTNKVRFSNAPLVWLKEVSNFLNSKTQVEIDDPTFSKHAPDYLVSLLPTEVKSLLSQVLRDAGKANTQLFYDVTLTAIANDLSRGQSVNGHRLLIQLLAQEHPEFCVSSIQKSISLMNSYQNRPPIGLTLLWAVGLGGLREFSVGLKAWEELFLPTIELKHYTTYIVTYLSNLLDRHIKMKSASVTQDQLFAILDMVNGKSKNLPKELSSDLIKQLSKVKDIYFSTASNKLQVVFNQLMKKLPNQYLSGPTLDPYNQVIVQCLVDCLKKDDSCNATWRQLFHRCSKQSATLLDYINNNWSEVSPHLKQKSLKGTVLQYKEVGTEALKGKKKDETIVKTNKACQDILDRMTSTRRFPWLWASFFLLLSIAGLIAYDVSRVNGNFPKSATGKLFNDLGILEQSQHAWRKTLSSSARGYLWLETNAPIYYKTSVEYSKPYAELIRDSFIVGATKAGALYTNVKEYAIEKYPVVVATIDQYAPGLIDNMQSYTYAGWSAVKKYSGDYYKFTADYLTTKVFVGDWAPDVLQNKTHTALNVTRLHVSNYFVWLRQQVNVYSEIP